VEGTLVGLLLGLELGILDVVEAGTSVVSVTVAVAVDVYVLVCV
jgi:hypothetical protein